MHHSVRVCMNFSWIFRSNFQQIIIWKSSRLYAKQHYFFLLNTLGWRYCTRQPMSGR
jgi:hypothetical protein